MSALADRLEAEAAQTVRIPSMSRRAYFKPLHEERINALLREAAAELRKGEWLPIESAPEKGNFLVSGGEWVGESKDGNQRQKAGVTMVNRTHSRSRFYVADADEFWPWIEGPTHWQAAPAAAGGDAT